MDHSVSRAAHQADIDSGNFSTVPGVGQYLPDGNFVLWREEPGEPGKKPRKVPVHPDGRRHSAQAPQPRHSLAEAAAHPGCRIGYRIPTGSGIVCLDLDNCILRDGTDTAAAALARSALVGAVIERSVSGTGLHFWFIAPGRTNTGAKAHPLLGDFDLFADDQKFVALGRWESGTGPLPDLGAVLAMLVPQESTREDVRPADWESKTDQQRAECREDLRSALAHAYNPDSRDDWIAAGQALASLGEDGRALWEEWSATSSRFPGGEGLDRWDTLSGDRSDYRSIFARASRAGWKQPHRTADPTKVFGVVPVELPEGATTEAPALASFARTGDIRDGFGDCPPLTFPGNAQRVALLFGDRLRWAHDAQKWLVWDGGRWSITDEAVILSDLAQRLPASIYAEGSRVSHPDAMRHFPEWARKTGDPAALRKTLDIVRGRTEHRVSLIEFDADAYLLGFDGGRQVVDLRSGRTRPAQQGDRVTRSCAVPALGDPARATRWQQFIREVTCDDVELADWLHRFLGYCLTGSTTEQAFGFFFGHGANGKSVLTETMLALMGDYGASVQPATLCDADRKGGGATADLARLEGVRFAVAPEAEEGSRFAESVLKALVSGDVMQVRDLYAPPRDMRPCLKLVLTGNHKPDIRGTDRGIWRRVRLVPFAASFEGRADPRLLEKLRTEIPHILAWLVAGCREWQRRPLRDTPRAIASATDEYRAECDLLGRWLEERCTRDPMAEESAANLYADFRDWSIAGGYARPWTVRVFGRKLSEYRLNGWDIGERKGTAGTRLRTGIALRLSPGRGVGLRVPF